MIVFRLAKSKFCKDLSGRGAETAGGRWNSKGTVMVYTGMSRALCTTEIAVHTPLGNIPSDYNLISIEFPDNSSILKLENPKLPKDWKSFPHPNSTQLLGDKFVADAKFLIMQVPSVIVQGEYNYLLNPNHKDFKKVKIIKVEPFVFDERLFVK
jgi:RES domain-containing protein